MRWRETEGSEEQWRTVKTSSREHDVERSREQWIGVKISGEQWRVVEKSCVPGY
jgi:hypothetical protein